MGTTRGMPCIVHVPAAVWNVKAEAQEAAVPDQESRSSSGGPGRDPQSKPRVTQQLGGYSARLCWTLQPTGGEKCHVLMSPQCG